MRSPTHFTELPGFLSGLEQEGFNAPADVRGIITTAETIPSQQQVLVEVEARLKAAIGASDAVESLEQATMLGIHKLGVLNDAADICGQAALEAVHAVFPFAEAFERVAEAYNAEAVKLVSAVKLVDPEADPDDLSVKQLVAWQMIPGLRARLGYLADSLTAVRVWGTGDSIGQSEQVGMCFADPGTDEERRRLLQVWKAHPSEFGGRGGRWTFMMAAGFQLKATMLGDHWTTTEPIGDAVGKGVSRRTATEDDFNTGRKYGR